MLARAGAMAGAEALLTATTVANTSIHTAEAISATPKSPLLVGREELTRNYFRLCIELSSPHNYSRLASVNGHSSYYLTFPGDCFSPLSQSSPGVSGNYRNFCFNWRLAQDRRQLSSGIFDTKDSLDGQQTDPSRTYFGSGPIEMVDMVDKLGENWKRALKLSEEVAASNFIPFSTGRAQISSGVIHVLRDFSNVPLPVDDGHQHTTEGLERESVSVYQLPPAAEHQLSSVGAIYHFNDFSVVLLMAIPVSFSPAKLIGFVGLTHMEHVERIRLLRDAAPNRYMALMRFDTGSAADCFIRSHDGRAYSPLEPEICHALLVSSVEFTTKASILEPLFDGSDFLGAEGIGALQSGDFVEVPTCPVCLERIDSAATGIMIVSCQHKFHCQCLERWGDGRCPVCRFALQANTGDRRTTAQADRANDRSAQCSACRATDNIWLCLICGNAGCGRYDEGHANDHYCRTGHNFALEVATHRVWDYLGDNYVHRLIQDQEDGKLVELPGPINSAGPETATAGNADKEGPTPQQQQLGKGETDPEYFSSLLVAQLESQRLFYEERMEAMQLTLFERLERLGKEHAQDVRRLSNALQASQAEVFALRNEALRGRQQLLADIDRLSRENARLTADLESERAMSEQAASSTAHYVAMAQEREAEIESLREQLHDLMVHIESQEQVKASDQGLSGGTIIIGRSPSKKSRHKRVHNK